MITFLFLLSILNTLGIMYLAYLILKKYRGPTSSQSEANVKTSVQKVGLYRYNPFEDLGGDQSFSLSILDSTNSGVILTSLHHRNFTRIYAKPIKNGNGDTITLSNEEKSAIVKAIKH